MKQSSSSVISELQQKGFRITSGRRSILEVLSHARSPLSAREIQSAVQRTGTHLNKTTIYRELDFLLREQILRLVQFEEARNRFELAPKSHHHHVVCSSCDRVEDILIEEECPVLGQSLAQATQFKILNHSLEFFGLCNNCQ